MIMLIDDNVQHGQQHDQDLREKRTGTDIYFDINSEQLDWIYKGKGRAEKHLKKQMNESQKKEQPQEKDY